MVSKKSYDKFVEDTNLLRAYLQRNEYFVITGYQWYEFSFTVIRNFLGFVLNLQYLFHNCNHYQDENKEQIVDVIFLNEIFCAILRQYVMPSVIGRCKHLQINKEASCLILHL